LAATTIDIYDYGHGGIWTSSDSGTNWIQYAPTNSFWSSIVSSADGTKLAAVANYGSLWTSGNSGTNWAQQNAPLNIQALASSSDGSKLGAVVNDGSIWISTNSGSIWTFQADAPPGCQSITSSSDGNRLVVSVSIVPGNSLPPFRIWTYSGPNATTTGSDGYVTGGPGTSVELMYTGGGQFVIISQRGLICQH
jgi:photosystem II stability/assembly factor-like uncharacterized protein